MQHTLIAMFFLLFFLMNLNCFLAFQVSPVPAYPRHNVHVLSLFFRATAENASSYKPPGSISESTIQLLSSGDLSFPYTLDLDQRSFGGGEARDTLKSVPITVLRVLEWSDLDAVADICMAEYGDDRAVQTFLDKPSLSSFSKLLDEITLRPLVYLSMILKLGKQDHVVLLAEEIRPNECGTLIGMVEVSQQPVEPRRNPPVLPAPMIMKQLYSIVAQVPMEGWITNLLVDKPFRGRGYAKLLMAAAEGVAKTQFSAKSMHLHCDADPQNGRVPQKLYEAIGYKPLMSSSDEYLWMGPENLASSVFVVEGVPLLYLRKELD